MIDLFSFFAGIGIMDLGFELQDYRIQYVNELYEPFLNGYKEARKILKIQEPDFGYSKNVTDLLKDSYLETIKNNIAKLRRQGSTVGFIGGPPCPDFSIAGKNKGREGGKGRLSLTFVQLICKLKPDFFFFENVKGLVSTKKHKKFYDELKGLLKKKGYLLSDELLNTISYGVPQDRTRIFLIGINKSFPGLLSKFPKGHLESVDDFSFPWFKYANYNKNQLNKLFKLPWPTRDPFKKDSVLTKPDNIPEKLTVEYWFRLNDVYSHPNSKNFFSPKASLKKFTRIEEGDDSKKSFKRLHRWRYSPTACYGNNEVHLHPYKARRLSAAEALAIQSLPKNFSLPNDMTLTDMFKSIANGVPYLASRKIAQTIKDFIEEEI